MKGLRKILKGWGGAPAIKATEYQPESISEIQQIISSGTSTLARGGGNSYGDSSLLNSVISTKKLTRIQAIEEDWIELEAGATIEQVLQFLLPRGRFLSITPGTKAVTIGGAIASDVHGKNHASAGSFFNITESLVLINESGERLRCSRQENSSFFYRCFGGMGLQGIIISAVLQTIPLPSHFITERQFIAGSLPEMFRLMKQHQNAPYLVGWLDLLNEDVTGIVKSGAWDMDRRMHTIPQAKVISIPFRFPVAPPRFLFRWYNKRYLAKARKHPQQILSLHQFFYPLDSIRNWRYVFGRKGLLQYHFRLPLAVSENGIEAIVEAVRKSKAVCTLAVLKRFGKGNLETPYSFAKEGYNLALDFIHTPAAVQFISRLDETVLAFGGKIYKAKDAFSGLPEAIESSQFQSLQNQRYGQAQQQ